MYAEDAEHTEDLDLTRRAGSDAKADEAEGQVAAEDVAAAASTQSMMRLPQLLASQALASSPLSLVHPPAVAPLDGPDSVVPSLTARPLVSLSQQIAGAA